MATPQQLQETAQTNNKNVAYVQVNTMLGIQTLGEEIRCLCLKTCFSPTIYQI